MNNSPIANILCKVYDNGINYGVAINTMNLEQKIMVRQNAILKALDNIKGALPVEMANSKIASNYDKYHIGFNDAIKQMNEALGIGEEKEGE